MGRVVILATKNCLRLARKVARYKGVRLLNYEVKKFADGEYYFRLKFLKKPTSAILLGNITEAPYSLFELLALAQALQDSGIAIATLCIPYLGYGRQDRQSAQGEAVLARMIAEIINRIPARRRVFVDLHSAALRAMLAPHIELLCLPDMVRRGGVQKVDIVVAPDEGARRRAESVAQGLPVITIPKRRPKHNIVARGGARYPVAGERVLMVDDMIDTGRTIASAAALLKQQGAKSITVAATHAIFSAPSRGIMAKAPIDKILVSDTLDTQVPRAVRVISIARQLAHAITIDCPGSLMGGIT